jgi:hypothetical protein
MKHSNSLFTYNIQSFLLDLYEVEEEFGMEKENSARLLLEALWRTVDLDRTKLYRSSKYMTDSERQYLLIREIFITFIILYNKHYYRIHKWIIIATIRGSFNRCH